MPNTETVRALVSAFNVHNYARNTVKTNFMLQSRGKKDYIVVLFDKGMKDYQCSEYLYNIKRKIVGEFYGIEEGDTDEVVLNTAKLIFDVESFPFNNYKGSWSVGKHGGFEFVAPIDKGVIFNLKSHLAFSLKKDVQEDMSIYITAKTFNKKKYLWCGEFDNEGLRKKFEHEFLFRMRERYENAPRNPLKIEGNSVYIKDVFDDARFIDSVTRYIEWLIGRDLQADSKNRSDVRAFKDLIMEILDPSTHVVINAFLCASPLNREEASILIPVILSDRGARFLTAKEAGDINHKFSNLVLDDMSDKTQATFKVNGSSEIYGIDFSNKEISHCVITKIIESSVINKDHELSIDPELHFRALSPAQSPFNSPTHAGQSGLRTPPNKRKADTESGYDSNSPLQLKDSGSSSGGPGPSSKVLQTQLESPTRSQDGALEDSPRQGSEKSLLHNHVNLAGTSKGFWSRSHLSSSVTNPHSSKCVGAAKNVQAGTSAWSFQASSAGSSLWSQSEPSSSKGAAQNVPAWTNTWTQNPNPLPPLPPLIPLPVSGSSVSGFQLPVSFTSTRGPGSSPPPLILSSGGIVPRFRPPVARPSSSKGASERRTSDKPLTEKEEKLIEALLYWFNFNNYALDPPHTNFIVKNGKIASLIDDSVNVKEYLQEIIDKTKEEYRVNKKEAYDLNEFPFDFLSNCEKNQETTVVANISRGALSNLKELFIQEQKPKKKVKIEDININIVEEAVKSKKKEWVDSQVREHGFPLKAAIESCYPDESALKHISIIKDKGGYQIDHTYDSSEVKSLKKQLCTKGKSKAEKMKSENNKDSGISSGEATDAENVSSKAEATASDYESMGCENTGKKSLKHKSPSPEDGGSPRKSPRSENSNSSSEEAGDSPRSNLSEPKQVREQLSKTGISKW